MAKRVNMISDTVVSVTMFSYKMNISDIVIGIILCCFYIFAAVIYVVTSQIWKIAMIIIIYLCHGTAVTITTSLTSKMVEHQELGRLNSIQTGMNFILTMGTFIAYNVPRGSYYHFSEFDHYCLVILLYAVLTLPILGVFVAFHIKYRDFLTEKTPTTINNSIYTISR
ncbi:uncharacterized protein LOC112689391 [Sipha flava]|uniref:Uncharacterized protein LOC112689391 n=1 Tax=Sipha flava TaxID=143950 RepID=A0A8B8G806_9HEMI|nr:uncharacterized protein LOC112689391 [Sipha flava]